MAALYAVSGGYGHLGFVAMEKAGGTKATDESVIDVLNAYQSSDILGFKDVGCPGQAAFIGACNPWTYMITIKDGEIHDGGGFVKSDFSTFGALLGG